jgi:glycosyltransferase involved in cell wall biosynthesis
MNKSWSIENVSVKEKRVIAYQGFFPRITIVTPSFNQGQYIEETINSVLQQNYPYLEYIIIDGGSSDRSVEIISRNAARLFFWTSQKDNGQAEAIHQGFELGSGQILGWLNSDDTLTPGALLAVGKIFCQQPDVQVVYGNANMVDKNGKIIRELHDVPFNRWAYVFGGINMHQASVFWRRSIYHKVGGLQTSLNYAMDYDLFLRFANANAKFYYLNRCLANYRLHEGAKTVKHRGMPSAEAISSKRNLVREPSLIYSCGHLLFQMRRLIWFFWQKDYSYIIRGFRNRIFKPFNKIDDHGF